MNFVIWLANVLLEQIRNSLNTLSCETLEKILYGSSITSSILISCLGFLRDEFRRLNVVSPTPQSSSLFSSSAKNFLHIRKNAYAFRSLFKAIMKIFRNVHSCRSIFLKAKLTVINDITFIKEFNRSNLIKFL